MGKIYRLITQLVMNKKYGRKYFFTNIFLAIFPFVSSIRNRNYAWIISFTILGIYMISYLLAELSERYKKDDPGLEPNFIIKLASFLLSMVAMLVYKIVGLFLTIPVEVVYILSYAIISLFCMMLMLINGKVDYKEVMFGNKDLSIKNISIRNILQAIFMHGALIIFGGVVAITFAYKALRVITYIISYIK